MNKDRLANRKSQVPGDTSRDELVCHAFYSDFRSGRWLEEDFASSSAVRTAMRSGSFLPRSASRSKRTAVALRIICGSRRFSREALSTAASGKSSPPPWLELRSAGRTVCPSAAQLRVAAAAAGRSFFIIEDFLRCRDLSCSIVRSGTRNPSLGYGISGRSPASRVGSLQTSKGKEKGRLSAALSEQVLG